MDSLDIYYRAWKEYQRQTSDERECARLNAAIAGADPEEEAIEVTTTVCTVEEDWIQAIEEGLVHVEKAIAEERQFIRSNGEVLPIEKVKRVSKDSVEHLARHSSLITKKIAEEDGTPTPDHLYTVERLSDYAVYENRFLYMLLCYLRDFISLRYQKILELTCTYNGRATVSKTVAQGKRRVSYELRLTEERRNDRYLKEHNELKGTIARIDRILKSVTHYLAAPLMEQVAKAAMLKPPVTKTNVLKMDRNFKGAVTLYEFVSSYKKAGYTAERRTKRIGPFPERVAAAFAEGAALSSFLVYEHGLGIEEELKRAYEEEERRRKEEEGRRLAEQLRTLQKRIRDSGAGAEEYMLLLEKRNRKLEESAARLLSARRELERLSAETQVLKRTLGELNGKIDEQAAEIGELHRLRAEERAALLRECEEKLARLNETHRLETEKRAAEHAEEILALNDAHEREVAGLNESHEKALAESEARLREREERLLAEREEARRTIAEAEERRTAQIAALCAKHQAETARFEEERRERTQELERLDEEKGRIAKDKTLSDARLNALRKEYGLIDDDAEFISDAEFGELEHQFKVFKEFFRTEWKKTKKRIRKEVLSARGKEPEIAQEASERPGPPAEPPGSNE